MARQRVGQILLEHRKLGRPGLVLALAESRHTRRPVLSVLRRRGLIDVYDAASALLVQSCAGLDQACPITAAFSGVPSCV